MCLSDPVADRALRKTIKHIDNCSLSVMSGGSNNSVKQQQQQGHQLAPPAHPSTLPSLAVTNTPTSRSSKSSRQGSPATLTTGTTNTSRLSSPDSSNHSAGSNERARMSQTKLPSSRSTSSSSAVSQDCFRAHDLSEKLL